MLQAQLPRRGFLAALTALAICLSGSAPEASAQAAYPTKPIKFIVPYAVGGLPDVVIRNVGLRLGERLQQPIVVENKPGAGGVAAAEALRTSPPDGYTFIFSDAAMLSIAPHIFKNLPYDAAKDFRPVSYVGRAPNFVVVSGDFPAKSFAEFVARAKEQPGTITCGSSGVGSLHHLTLELMQKSLGIKVLHVPFRGSGQSVPALLGGQITCLLASLAPLVAAVADGRVRILAVAGTNPTSVAPNVPPIGAAMNGFDSAFVLGVLARREVPDEIVNKLSSEIAIVLKEPAIINAFTKQGVEAIGGGPAEYEKALAVDAKQMAEAIKLGNLKSE